MCVGCQQMAQANQSLGASVGVVGGKQTSFSLKSTSLKALHTLSCTTQRAVADQ